MSSRRLLDLLLALLVVGIVGQGLVAIVSRGGLSPTRGSQMAVGDTLISLRGYREAGVETTVRLAAALGTATILYVFHPECVHCHAVAPEWAEHFSANRNVGSVVHRIAVTNDSVESGVAYAERFGWKVDVLSVQELTPGSWEYSLLSRTPWVFVFDSFGVLRFQGHGSRLDQMMQAISILGDVPVTFP